MSFNGFEDFLVWCSMYRYVKKDIYKENPLKTVIFLEEIKGGKVLKLVVDNAVAVIFCKVWGIIQERG